MKKNVLALSIAAMIGGLGFAGAASAVVLQGTDGAGATVYDAANLGASTATTFALSDGGVGHNLIVPYFTAQDGNMTVLHITNTDTKNGKAVKIRFRGAANSDDILDFQILMSPGDVWTGAVTAGASGVAQLTTADGTCTVPALTKGVAQSFDTRRLQPSLSDEAKAAGTREGYVEIFNMADIPSDSLYGAGATNKSTLYTAIKHVNGTAPCTASVIDAALLKTDHTETTAAAAGFATPTTGLMGDWYIINVAKTTTFSGGATALKAVDGAGADSRGNFVVFPQLSAAAPNPDLSTADASLRAVLANVFTAKNQDGTGTAATAAANLPVVEAAFYDLPDLSTPYLVNASTPLTAAGAQAQAQLLTRALAVKTITNQYANDASISAKTDWVFSMPTRRYSVAMDYRTATPVRVFTPGVVAAGAGDAFFYTGNTAVEAGKICVNSNGQSFWDREETSKSSGAVFSPGSVDKTRFCGETSVLSFGDAGTSVLGATVARQDTGASAYVNGWSSISTANNTAGLPILGSAFIKLTNPQASAGMSGTYGITWPHRFTK
jgi:hypothetical protein